MIHDFSGTKMGLKLDVDAVVVGSGAGGAVAAFRLRRAGKSVVLVEEGSWVKPEEFVTDTFTAFRQLYRDNGGRFMVGTMLIPTMQARCVGGTTVINNAVCFRLPDDVLDEWVDAEKLTGLSPEVLAPQFDEIENFLNICPEPDEHLGGHNLLMKKGCEALGWKGEYLNRNTRGCKGCGVCMTGCVEGAKTSMDRSFVPAFVEAGGELVTDCRVEKILTENGRAIGISGTMIDPATRSPSNKTVEVRARAVVISCGAMGTPTLLQKNNLANSSGLVGRNLVNHAATGMLGIFNERVDSWNGASFGYCCTSFRRDGFVLEAVGAPPDLMGIRVPGFGLSHKNMMGRAGYGVLWGAMVRTTTRGRVIARKNSWSPVITYNMTHRDARLMQAGLKATADLFFATGAREVATGINKVPPVIYSARESRLIMEADLKATDFSLLANHPAGTCRMSEDRKKGVVNSRGETHDVRGLYIADASIFPGPPGVNPQETIMGLSAHIADGIAQIL